jgi:predicted 3-demethylubiquinone-9 3-methyltransferase (glyoxalase superfamily)
MQKIVTSLWFDKEAEQAAQFYISIFPDSRINAIARYGPAGPGAEGSVMTIDFQLRGQDFNMINGGPEFKFSEAISLLVNCADQAEVDELWEKLGAGGEYSVCGWLKDRYGLSWQIVPTVLGEMLSDPDPIKAKRVMEVMLKMSKIEIEPLQEAYEGASG